MDDSYIVDEFIRITKKHLQGTQSQLAQTLIGKVLEDEVIMNNDIPKAISKIKTTIRLFVDEKKAEDISKELKRLMGL